MIALIDYGAGNTASVSNILKELNADFILTNDKANIKDADKIILPGVGEASSATKRLMEFDLIDTLRFFNKPFLGICLGMQLLCKSTEEGNSECLRIIPVVVKRFNRKELKIPHMGWNSIKKINDDKLYNNISDDEYFYFAHSYFVPQNEFITSICNYGIDFSASLRHKNFYGVQFHPEKSAQQGIKIIKNFLEIC
jgi:imidazole glycerol-phosphate synthase subunit HisH